ncbi:MAG: TIGR01777 family oxidoreductase [Bacteroidota bacterium]
MPTVLIAGGSGLVGSRLSQLLTDKGYTVIHLSRKARPNATYQTFRWDLRENFIAPEAIQRADYVVSLAGAGIADQRWSAARKKLIIDSRVRSNLLLKNAFEQAGKVPKAYVAASAIGYYGDRGEELMDEKSDPGKGFLPESCIAWENALHAVADSDWRTVILRIGIVLSTQGGALEKMILPMRFGTGPYFGDGQQFYSWIHIDDLCRMFLQGLEKEQMNGTYNAVSPYPISNKQLTYELGRAMDKKALYFSTPSFALRLAMGEMADVVLISTRVSSRKIESTGFEFQFPAIQPALKDVLERKI